MAETIVFQSASGVVALHKSAGAGRPIVLIHGNSSSSRAFSRQLDGPLGQRRRPVAIDLLGHGRSENASDPLAYRIPGHARTLVETVEALGLDDAIFLGWSLGGHIALEAAPALPSARGFAIFGAPPLAFPPAMDRAFLPNPAMGAAFAETVTPEQAEAFVASCFAPGFADVPSFVLEDYQRAVPAWRGGATGQRRLLRRGENADPLARRCSSSPALATRPSGRTPPLSTP